jgi:TetR/AcrR family transcriptional repressor of nem operon
VAVDTDDLPSHVRVEVDRFTSTNTRWLVRVLAARHPNLAQSALEARALAIFAAIEGAQLVARGRKDIQACDQIIEAYSATGLFS